MSQFYDQASLVMIPSGYKTGKVYSQKPLSADGQLTFTRASNASRIGPDGLLEKVRTNSLLQSNTFSTTWSLFNATLTSGQIGYDGSSDAWLLDKSGTQGRITQAIAQSDLRCLSVYAKKGTSDYMRMFINGPNSSIYFDLTDGSVQSSSSIVSGTATALSGGWYRCEVSFTGTSTAVNFYPAESGSTAGTSGNIYIQNAQLEQGLVATPYIETTTAAVSVGPVANLPRLSYDPANPTCPSLLLESQRTNKVAFSEYFENWTIVGSVSIDTNYGISPEGLQNSTRVVFSDASESIRTSISHSVNEEISSIYIKGTDGQTIKFGRGPYASSGDLFTLNGDWQRIDFSSTSGSVFVLNTYSGATARDIQVYGAQLEEGAYATSYIPTYGTATTRGADNTLTSGLSGSLPQTAGTLFWEIDYTLGSTSTMLMHNTGVSDYGFLQIGISGSAEGGIYESGTIVDRLSYSGLTSGRYKMAFAYETNSFALCINGVLRDSGTSGSTASVSMNTISLDWNTTDFTRVHQALLFPTRLTNAQLAELTA